MNENNKLYYSNLVNEVEAYKAGGHTFTRFQMLEHLCEQGFELNRDMMDMVEQLYADGFIEA